MRPLRNYLLCATLSALIVSVGVVGEPAVAQADQKRPAVSASCLSDTDTLQTELERIERNLKATAVNGTYEVKANQVVADALTSGPAAVPLKAIVLCLRQTNR